MNDVDKRYSLVELIALMHEHRLTHIKLGSMELEMSPSAFAPDALPDSKGQGPVIKTPVAQDFLVWSLQDSALDTPEAS